MQSSGQRMEPRVRSVGGCCDLLPKSKAIACSIQVISGQLLLRTLRMAVVPAATAWRARQAHCCAPGRTQAATRLSPSTCLIPSCLLRLSVSALLLSIQTASTARSCAARTAMRDSMSLQPLQCTFGTLSASLCLAVNACRPCFTT
jgi:hypothetical protein